MSRNGWIAPVAVSHAWQTRNRSHIKEIVSTEC